MLNTSFLMRAKKSHDVFSTQKRPNTKELLLWKFPISVGGTVKLGNKERFVTEQIGVKEPFSMTNCQCTS